MSEPGITIEVFADMCCPFTHLGLQRFVARRAAVGRDDVRLWVRAWPLEIVNGTPLDAGFIAEEIDDIRNQVAPDAFAGFDARAFPASSVPAMTLAAVAYETGLEVGEAVSLELRDRLFERGLGIADADELTEVAARHGLVVTPGELADPSRVLVDHAAGLGRGVIGSPHFFTPAGGFFCPALDVHRDDRGHLHIHADPLGFDAFLEACFT